jgi:hypothetical protein
MYCFYADADADRKNTCIEGNARISIHGEGGADRAKFIHPSFVKLRPKTKQEFLDALTKQAEDLWDKVKEIQQ